MSFLQPDRPGFVRVGPHSYRILEVRTCAREGCEITFPLLSNWKGRKFCSRACGAAGRLVPEEERKQRARERRRARKGLPAQRARADVVRVKVRAPGSSWWLGVQDREAFAQLAAERQPLMNLSREARKLRPMTLCSWT